MKVCVLQPDYAGSQVDYRHYDPPRYLSALLPDDRIDYLFLRKATTYRQLIHDYPNSDPAKYACDDLKTLGMNCPVAPTNHGTSKRSKK